MNADLKTVLKSKFKLLVQACWWVLESPAERAFLARRRIY